MLKRTHAVLLRVEVSDRDLIKHAHYSFSQNICHPDLMPHPGSLARPRGEERKQLIAFRNLLADSFPEVVACSDVSPVEKCIGAAILNEPCDLLRDPDVIPGMRGKNPIRLFSSRVCFSCRHQSPRRDIGPRAGFVQPDNEGRKIPTCAFANVLQMFS